MKLRIVTKVINSTWIAKKLLIIIIAYLNISNEALNTILDDDFRIKHTSTTMKS